MSYRLWFAAVLLGWCGLACASIPKTIFDDDWQAAPTPPAAPAPITTNSQPPATSSPSVPDSANTAPAAPSAEGSATRPARLPVPTPAEQADSWKLIKGDLFKSDIASAKTPAQKVELAKKLLSVADETKKDDVSKYVLLAQAKELAIGSGDYVTAFQCLDRMGASYDINYPSMKLDLFAALAGTVSSPADIEAVTVGLNQWADGQVRADRYESAKRACDIALGVARKDRAGKLAVQTTAHRSEVEQTEAAYLATKTALTNLSKTPGDPAANLLVGRFYCFTKGDWHRGIPFLARSNDQNLKPLALLEIAGAPTPESQMTLADKWWDAAATEHPAIQKQIREHARKLYEQARPSLDGLALVKAEKRIAQAQESDATPGPAAKPKSNWVLLFRASDPTAWNTDAKDEKRFAIPLSDAPHGLQYLKMQIDPTHYVIIPMTNEALAGENKETDYGWDGRNAVAWGGHQLGIYGRHMNDQKSNANGWVCIYWDTGPYTGWGFGYRAGANDQGFAWDGQSVGTRICEIYVTTSTLSPAEKQHLLTGKK